MARVMSFITTVFILVPAIAPAIGQGLLLVAGWRSIFWTFFAFAVVAVVWFGVRHPETHPEHLRAPFTPRRIATAVVEVCRTRTTLSLLVLMVFVGLAARSALPIANDPHVDLPLFYVGVSHDGISPEDAERLLVQPMEIELRKLEGIVELKSTASEGMASFFVEFDVSQDLDKALSDVREAVDAAKAEMPDTAEEPFVEEMTADDFPMLQVNLISEGVSEQVLYRAALRLRQQIETIPAVLSAELQGHRDEVLEVIIDPDALNAYRISVEELVVVLQRNNRLIPAGTVDLDSGRFAVKVPAVVERADEVLELPVRSNNEGVVTLRDVARVNRTFKDRTVTRVTTDRKPSPLVSPSDLTRTSSTRSSRSLRWWRRPLPCFRAVSASSRRRIRRNLRRYRYENSRAIS